MTNTPKISIVMACYNAAGFVGEAINSIAIQDYENWELVIVDDASTDNSVEVIKETIDRLAIKKKVRVYQNTVNQGYGTTLRKAVANSKGTLIAIVDSDDALGLRKALSFVVEVHTKHPEVALTYSDYYICDSSLEALKIYTTRQLQEGEKYIDTKIRISHLKCFKRKHYYLTKGITTHRNTVDKDLVLKLEEVGKLKYIHRPLYKYRRHKNNISLKMDKKDPEYVATVNRQRKLVYAVAKERRALNLNQWNSMEKCKSLQHKWGDYDLFAQEANSKNKWEVLEKLKELISKQSYLPRVLDVGCGTGHYMWAIKDIVSELTGLDFSSAMLKLTKQQLRKAGQKIKLIQSTCWNIPLPDNSVDIVYQVDVCMHVGGSWKSLVEMIRVSKKAVLFTGPSFLTDFDSKGMDKQFGKKSFAVNATRLGKRLNKLIDRGEIKSFKFIKREPTASYNHRILIVEK